MGPKSRKFFVTVFNVMTVWLLSMFGTNYYNVRNSESFERNCGSPLTEVCEHRLWKEVYEMPSMSLFDFSVVVWVTLTVIIVWVQTVELIHYVKQETKRIKLKRKRKKDKERE